MRKLIAVILASTVVVADAWASPSLLESLPSHEKVELAFGDSAIPRIRAQFVAHDPAYEVHHEARKTRLDALGARMFARSEAGLDTRCTRQIFLEAKWLVNYTAWWERIDERLDAIEQSFDLEDQRFADTPSLRDGFYGRCVNEEFIKIETTLVEYFSMAERGRAPSVDRVPIEAASSPEALTAFFDALLISDIERTGEDQRSRLGSLASIAAALFRRENLTEMVRTTVRGEPKTPEEQRALADHFQTLVDYWQDPLTGYWGAWYREPDGTVFKTTDLSFTYHIIHARKGRVNFWPQIIETTFAIRDDRYPFGWVSHGDWTNHNNYDIARIFNYGWEHMSERQREEAARLIREMVDWSFTHTVRPGYRGFIANPALASSLQDDFYFGASFLVAAEFFEPLPFYGPLERPAHPPDVCRGMLEFGRSLDGVMAASGVDKLARACNADEG